MVLSAQAGHSLLVPVSSDPGFLGGNFNPASVSSSCPHSVNDFPPCSVSSSNRETRRRTKELSVCGYGDDQNWKSDLPGKGVRSTGTSSCKQHVARRKAHGWGSSVDHQIEFSTYGRTLNEQNRGQSQSSLRCSAQDGTAAEGGSPTDNSVELPLFPLPLVLFPGSMLPLQIFEFRYRIMMQTLLQTDLRFGVVYEDKVSGRASVGCVGEVVKHERLVDDRFFMVCKGQERFRVKDIVRTKPYLVARVEWLEDRPSSSNAEQGKPKEDLEALADEVETYIRDVIRLTNRVNGGKKSGKVLASPDEDLRKKLFPTPFSFWVGSTFEGAPAEQQALLELEDTAQRLQRERETLKNTLNYLTAASAVKDAFSSAE